MCAYIPVSTYHVNMDMGSDQKKTPRATMKFTALPVRLFTHSFLSEIGMKQTKPTRNRRMSQYNAR